MMSFLWVWRRAARASHEGPCLKVETRGTRVSLSGSSGSGEVSGLGVLRLRVSQRARDASLRMTVLFDGMTGVFGGWDRKTVELRSMPTHRERPGRDEWGTRPILAAMMLSRRWDARTGSTRWPAGGGFTSHVSESRHGAPTVLVAVLASMLVAGVGVAGAQSAAGTSLRKKLIPSNTNVAASSLGSYLERVKADNQSIQPTAGAIWTDSGRLTRLNSDVRAMRPHDLIAVVVQESLAASTDGTVKNQRASSANSAITGLFGALKSSNALQNLLAQTSSNSLNAAGASATNSSLTTTFGGQVIDVLPNGMLVIEAARQVEFSQQTQTIVLRGLVRPEDISQQNEVLSTAISSLELEVKGKGIVNDYTRRQNPLVRFIQSILVF